MEQGILLLLMSLMVFVWALTTDFQHDRIEERGKENGYWNGSSRTVTWKHASLADVPS